VPAYALTEVDPGVASAGVAVGVSRNSERESWGFLGGFAEKRAPEAAARSRAVPDQSLRLKDATEPQ
jgi:hypothetical protein